MTLRNETIKQRVHCIILPNIVQYSDTRLVLTEIRHDFESFIYSHVSTIESDDIASPIRIDCANNLLMIKIKKKKRIFTPYDKIKMK